MADITPDDGRETTVPRPSAHPVPCPSAPASAAEVFGAQLAQAERFALLLADTGVSHGLIGPREVPILWERHILNCAVAHRAFPVGAQIVDVGSGAGLPGLALAIVRPDLGLHLVEPMLRRTTWLQTAVEDLGLTNVTVHRGRAEEFAGELRCGWATARAVARIDKLARWTFPLLEPGGTLVALKGSQAPAELADEEKGLRRLGMVSARVGTYGQNLLEVPTVTLELTVGETVSARAKARRARPSGAKEPTTKAQRSRRR